MHDPVAVLISAIIDSTVQETSNNRDTLTLASFFRLYRCTAKLIGYPAESALWERSVALSLARVDVHRFKAGDTVLEVAAEDGLSGADELLVAEPFVQTYIRVLSDLIGMRLTVLYLSADLRNRADNTVSPSTVAMQPRTGASGNASALNSSRPIILVPSW